MLKNKRVLITGAAGFVGLNLARRLVSLQYQVYIIIRKTTNQWRLKDVLSKVNVYYLDLTEKDKLEKLVNKIKPEIIFHLAAAGAFGGVESPRKELIDSNMLGTINLIDACSSIDYRCFVNTGSSSEYGSKNIPMAENDICQPTNLYGITKLAGSLYSQLVGNTQKKPIITFRLFSPFGPYDDKNRLITYAINSALNNKDLNLANPKGVRDYIYIDDVVDLYLKAIQRADKAKGEIFNIGVGAQRTVSEIVRKIIKLSNSKSKINWGVQSSRPWDNKIWEADMKKTSQFFSWQPRYSIDEGLKKTVEWFKNNLSLYGN